MEDLLALLVHSLQGCDAALESLLHLQRLVLVWEGCRRGLRSKILMLLSLKGELCGLGHVGGGCRSFANQLIEELILWGEALG